MINFLCISSNVYLNKCQLQQDTFKVHGYTIERKNFCILVWSPSHATKEIKVEIALAHLSIQWFHIRYSQKYVVENNIRHN